MVVGFIGVRVGSIGRAQGSSGLFGFAWVHSGTPMCLRVHSGSREFTLAHIEIVGFIPFRVGPLRSRSTGIKWVHSCAYRGRWVGFIRVRVGSLECGKVWTGSSRFGLVLSGA